MPTKSKKLPRFAFSTDYSIDELNKVRCGDAYLRVYERAFSCFDRFRLLNSTGELLTNSQEELRLWHAEAKLIADSFVERFPASYAPPSQAVAATLKLTFTAPTKPVRKARKKA